MLIFIYKCPGSVEDNDDYYTINKDVSVLPYESAIFHESIIIENYPDSVFIANPVKHRIERYQIDSNYYDTYSPIQLLFSESLYHNGTSMNWHNINTAGNTAGINTPVDFVITSNSGYIWILDQNGITQRYFVDGAVKAVFNPVSTECNTFLQIEYTDHLLVLSQDVSGNYYICHLDESTGNFNAANPFDAVEMTHPETSRLVKNVPHFKANINGIYIMQELTTTPPEFPVFFLEKRDMNFQFLSGVYLYEASGMSFFENQLVVSGRQRNYNDAVTVFNHDLDREKSYDAQVTPKLNGIVHAYDIDLFINSFEPNTTAHIVQK